MVADEAVQIHGGYGYIEEYPVCRIYRDIRVNRIFEGTNEVNRMLVAGDALKRGIGGHYDLPALIAAGEGAAPGADCGAAAMCADLRWAIGRLVATATQKFGPALEQEQLVLAGLADLIIELYSMDTAAAAAGQENAIEQAQALLDVATENARGRILGILAALGARLQVDDIPTLIAPFAAGARDVHEARDLLATTVLERGSLF